MMKNVLSGIDVAEAEFTPRAVARCSGLSQALQRVWRKRGHIDGSELATAKFETLEALSLAVRQQLSHFGMPPSQTAKIGGKAARTALYFALLNVSGACEILGPAKDVEELIRAFDDSDEIAALLSDAETTARYLWRGESGFFLFENDLQRALARERSIAISVLDLLVLGTRFGDLAERPLLTLSFGSVREDGFIRRLTNPSTDEGRN